MIKNIWSILFLPNLHLFHLPYHLEANPRCYFSCFAAVQLLTRVWLLVFPWTSACQASLSFSVSQSLLKLMSIESVIPSNRLISSSVTPFSSCPQSFPASGSFPMSWLSELGGQSIGASASALVLLMNIQDWFPLGWTGWISLQSKELSRVFSNTTVQKQQFFGTQTLWPNSHIQTWLNTGDLSWFDPWARKIPCRRDWQPTLVFLPEEFHGQRSLVGYTPWGCKESDMAEWLTVWIWGPLSAK